MTKLNSKSWKEKKALGYRQEGKLHFIQNFLDIKKYYDNEKYLNTERKALSR